MAAIQIPYERILETIQQKTSIPRNEIEAKIDAKLKQLSGLISKEGAAHIVANELGVRLFEQTSGKLKIANILAGMRDVETEGRIERILGERSFQSERGPGRFASFLMSDDTGKVRVVLWNDQVEKLKQLTEGSLVRIVGGYTKSWNDRVDVCLNDRSKLITLEVATAPMKQRPSFTRKRIRELEGEDSNVEIFGTIYQVFSPRFFEVCPQCGRRMKPAGNGFACAEHKEMKPEYSYVLNLFLDDGTGTIRLVCFREQVLRLMNIPNEQFLPYRDAPDSFEQVKNDLLGKIIKVAGRVTKNEMFDRLEFIAQLVYPNPDPREELERIEKSIPPSAPAAAEEPLLEEKQFLDEETVE